MYGRRLMPAASQSNRDGSVSFFSLDDPLTVALQARGRYNYLWLYRTTCRARRKEILKQQATALVVQNTTKDACVTDTHKHPNREGPHEMGARRVACSCTASSNPAERLAPEAARARPREAS